MCVEAKKCSLIDHDLAGPVAAWAVKKTSNNPWTEKNSIRARLLKSAQYLFMKKSINPFGSAGAYKHL